MSVLTTLSVLYFRLKGVICFGEGAGANILARFAVRRPISCCYNVIIIIIIALHEITDFIQSRTVLYGKRSVVVLSFIVEFVIAIILLTQSCTPLSLTACSSPRFILCNYHIMPHTFLSFNNNRPNNNNNDAPLI